MKPEKKSSFLNPLKGINVLKGFIVSKKPLIESMESTDKLYEVLMILLKIYEESQSKSFALPSFFKRSDTIVDDKTMNINASKDKDKDRIPLLSEVNHTIIFFLLNLTLDDFHKSYVKFYIKFDKDNSLYMEEEEFRSMVEFLCDPEHLGSTKLNRCFEKIAESTYNEHKKIDQLFESVEQDKIGPNVIKGMFDVLKSKDTITDENGNKIPFIDYIKFLPVILSFFSEHLKHEAKSRRDNIEIITGLDEAKNLLKGTHISLITKLEGLGLKYSVTEDQDINFRILEKAIILFRNAYTSTFGNQQLQIILDELRIKLHVDPKTGKEAKPKKFTRKLLSWIAFRICLHCSCQHLSHIQSSDKHAFSEEYTYWSAAINLSKIDGRTLSNKFIKNASKIAAQLNIQLPEESKSILHEELEAIFKVFIRKIIPHIGSESISSIVTMFYATTIKKRLQNTDEFGRKLYNLLIEEAKRKLLKYLRTTFQKFKKAPIKSKEMIVNVNDSDSPEEFNVLGEAAKDSDEEREKIQEGIIFEERSRSFIEPSEIEEPISAGIINESKVERKTDILNSCFIMETFLEKYLYGKDVTKISTAPRKTENSQVNNLEVKMQRSSMMRHSEQLSTISEKNVTTKRNSEYNGPETPFGRVEKDNGLIRSNLLQSLDETKEENSQSNYSAGEIIEKSSISNNSEVLKKSAVSKKSIIPKKSTIPKKPNDSELSQKSKESSIISKKSDVSDISEVSKKNSKESKNSNDSQKPKKKKNKELNLEKGSFGEAVEKLQVSEDNVNNIPQNQNFIDQESPTNNKNNMIPTNEEHRKFLLENMIGNKKAVVIPQAELLAATRKSYSPFKRPSKYKEDLSNREEFKDFHEDEIKITRKPNIVREKDKDCSIW